MLNQNTMPKRRRNLQALYNARLEALKRGDVKALQAIEDKIFYAKLNPADPDYERKVALHKKHMRIQNATNRANEVIAATKEPLTFSDSFFAINDAIDKAVATFERVPCPKHAADLLGLINCRNLLLESDIEEIDEAPEEDD